MGRVMFDRRRLFYISTIVCFSLWSNWTIAEKTHLVVAADPWCPFNCVEKHDGAKGYIVDALELIAKKNAWTIDYQVQPWSRVLLGLSNGAVDIAIGVDPKDANQLISTQTWGVSHSSAVLSVDNQWEWSGVSHLQGKRALIIAGYYYPGALGEWIIAHPTQIEEVHGETALGQAMAMLDRKRADLLFNSAEVVNYYLFRYKMTNKYRVVSTGFSNDVKLGIRSSRQDAELMRNSLDHELLELRRNGQLEKMLSRYKLNDWIKQDSQRAH